MTAPLPGDPAPVLGPADTSQDTSAETAARKFLADALHLDTSKLGDALAAVYGEAYAAGVLTGLHSDKSTTPAVPGIVLSVPSNAEEWQSYWGSWEPGHDRTAGYLGSGGLSRMLDAANITIQGITGSMLDRLGNALADAARRGDSVDTAAKHLSSIIDNPARARMIANTEIARAMSLGSKAQYRQDGVTLVNLITSPGACPTCLAIAAGNPNKLRNVNVPIHPNCRCSISPVLSPIEPGPSASQDIATVAGAAAGAGLLTDTEEGFDIEAAINRAIDKFTEDQERDEENRLITNYEQDTAGNSIGTAPSTQDIGLDENQGGGMTGFEENTGAGSTIADRNTGGGGSGLNANTGGGEALLEQNTGGGTTVGQAAGAPAPAKPTKRTRKRAPRKR